MAPRISVSRSVSDFAAFAGPTPSGTLTVKMLDPLTSQVLWSGTISEIKMKAIEPKKELSKAVWRVLVEFPPITG